MKAFRCRAAVALAAVSLAAGLAACGEGGESNESSEGGFTIGLLLPDVWVNRYEKFDRPLIEKRVEELCRECRVAYANAKGDVAAQHQQVDSMIASGVRVLLLDVVDAASLRSSIVDAERAGIRVVAYDRIAEGPVSAVVAYDLVEAGREQSEAVVSALGDQARSAQIVMLDTPPVIQETRQRTQGSLDALRGKVRDVRSYTITNLGVEGIYDGMSGAIADLGPGNIDGVVASNDLMASGVIAALKNAHVSPLPPVTGMDAELDAVQRIVQGDQYMTVYKPYEPLADAAAEMAVALGRGEELDAIAKDRINSRTHQDIPAALFSPVAVTVDNIENTVVKDGMYTIEQICTPKLASACDKAGLTR